MTNSAPDDGDDKDGKTSKSMLHGYIVNDDKDTSKETRTTTSFFCSARFGLAIMTLLLCFNVYAQRMGMSVAIVCMVNHTAVSELREQQRLSYVVTNNVSENQIMTTSNSLEQDEGGETGAIPEIDLCKKTSNESTDDAVSMDGPFSWTKDIQGHVLGSFFYGYLVSQIPSGLLAERFGARPVLIGFLGASTIGTLLTPLAAQLSYSALIIVRVIVGIGSGAQFPAMHAMWGQWAPPMERSKLAGISYAGSMAGTVVAMPLSGLLCRYGFSGGWPSVFYVIGGSSLLVLIVWAGFVTSTPATNRFVSAAEKKYIANSLAGEVCEKPPSWREMPWKAIVTSGPVWAVIVANFCMDWGSYTLMTNIPSFYREVLKFDIESNGLNSALPFVGLWVSMTLSPVCADYLRSNKILSTTVTRKLFTSIGLFSGAGFLIGLSFLDCTQTVLAVALMSFGAAMCGVSLSGFWVNHMDIAPRYAGTLMGLSNGLAAMSGFIAPSVASALTIDETRESWQKVFFISAGMYLVGAIVYNLLGTGVIQPWATDVVEPSISVDISSKASGDRRETTKV